MASNLKACRFTKDRQFHTSAARGFVLVYVVLVMVIFGLLSVAMISIFSTSISSSATRNDTRRAAYLSESGIRYAMSELRSKDFAKATITRLNTTVYKTGPTESLEPNVLSPWFEPISAIDIGAGGNGTEVVKLPEGKLPSGFVGAIQPVPLGSLPLTVVNYDYIGVAGETSPPGSARGTITGAAEIDGNPKNLQLTISDDGNSDGFVAGKNETLSFAVNPYSNQNLLVPGGTLLLQPEAVKVFPAVGGAFEFKRNNFYYEKAIDHGTYVELIGIKPVAGETQNSINAVTTDYVILSPRNRFILSEGKSGDVTFGNNMKYATGVSDISIVPPQSRKPDIAFEDEPNLRNTYEQVVESSQKDVFFQFDNDQKRLAIGGGEGPSFGAVWFNDTRSIGGQRNFCSTGKCLFGQGIRVFFTFTASSTPTSNFLGEGFVFSLTNGQDNSINSIGGDIQRSEVLGYAGDSRLTNPDPPISPIFLDGTGNGLQFPKIGLEFDTRINYSLAFEQNQQYCSGKDLIENTRNDPLSSDKHAVQYVFWAKDTLNLSCRNTLGRGTYDDNRHDAVGFVSGNWAKALFGDTRSSPVVGSDGTIYIGSAANKLFAIRPDGVNEKWAPFSIPTGEVYSPVLGNGRIYVGSEDKSVYAIDPSNGVLIRAVDTFNPVRTKPAVGSGGFVYATSGKSLFKIDFSTSPYYFGTFTTTFDITSSPAISRPDTDTVYVGFSDGKLYARYTSDLTTRWTSPPIGTVIGEPAVDNNGFIYVSAGNRLIKINPSDGEISGIPFNPGFNATSSPTLSKDGSTVYVGFSNGKLYALNTSDLLVKTGWPFPQIGSMGSNVSTPTVDDNDNVYVGSDNGFLYGIYADGSLKWEFDTTGSVRAKPAIDNNGVVYAGTNGSGGQMWAINQFTEPRNYRQNFENPPVSRPDLAKNLIAYSDSKAVNPYFTNILNPNKWFKDGPWAVRFEVDRISLTGNRAQYILRTWVQQCGDNDCTDIGGTFFEDTRIKYNPISKQPNLVQSFELDSTLNLKFNTFLFGFTSAKRDDKDDQLITVDKFQLSFIRPGDPEVDTE